MTITLTVSKGFEAEVPNVLGLDINKAKDILSKAGFSVTLNALTPPTTAQEIKNMKANVVLKQSLEAYTTVYEKNTSITLDYYTHVPELPVEPEEPDNDNNPDHSQTTPE